MKLRKNKGSEVITTPIIIAIGMIFVATMIVFCIKILTPYIWYEKLSSTCLKYVFIMEEFGYLTNKEKNNMISELVNQGFSKNNLKISCTSQRQGYGNPIYLNVNYTYKLNLPIVGEKTIPMNINRESVSKR
ncbi:MAG: hypothetical protein IKI57_03180 [Clostridia bacterium]|nr:hypothetical protein [Clostridia bacterium]